MIHQIKAAVYNSKWYIPYDRYKTQKLRKDLELKKFKSVNEFTWEKTKSSDTLFVLGTGLSIMSLSPKDWEEIGQHDSFGFNGWIFHDFNPTYYGIEPMASDPEFDMYIDAIRSKGALLNRMPIFVQYQHLIKRSKSFIKDGVLQDNVYYNAPYMPNTTNIRVLRRMLDKWVNLDHKDFSEVLHYAGSLSYVMTMAYIMGYKKIVLLGVDLNSSEYFFQHPEAGDLAKKFKHFQENRPKVHQVEKSKTHNTLSKKFNAVNGCLPISDFVEAFRDSTKPKGVEVLIGSKGSALYPMLDHWTI